jgi:predicted nucleic acid-binding protein
VSWATLAADPKEQPSVRSPDPGNDHLIELAEDESAALVSGDDHLLRLEEDVPIAAVPLLRLLEAERHRRES